MPTNRSLADRAAVLLATGLGFGFSKWMPGTVGAVWGLPLAWGVLSAPGIAWQLAILTALFAIGVPVCDRAVVALGGKKDPGAIVWDEIASMPIVFLAISPARLGIPDWSTADWRWWLGGFVLHRIFDITKPPPVRTLEALPGGLGIMADDTMAAIFAAAVLAAIQHAVG